MKKIGPQAMQFSIEILATLLKQRLAIISDHAFRSRDAIAHLAALREVSESIASAFESLKPQLAPRLRHYMEQASYTKALEYIELHGDKP
jgi:hypothetical protein